MKTKKLKYVYQWAVFGHTGDQETYNSIKSIKTAMTSAATEYARSGISGFPKKMSGADSEKYNDAYLNFLSEVSFYRAPADQFNSLPQDKVEWAPVKL